MCILLAPSRLLFVYYSPKTWTNCDPHQLCQAFKSMMAVSYIMFLNVIHKVIIYCSTISISVQKNLPDSDPAYIFRFQKRMHSVICINRGMFQVYSKNDLVVPGYLFKAAMFSLSFSVMDYRSIRSRSCRLFGSISFASSRSANSTAIQAQRITALAYGVNIG